MTGLLCDYFAGETITAFVVLPFHERELVRDFGEEDGTKSLKVFSKPSTQACVSTSEKGREVRVWRLSRLTEKGREVRVWRPPRLTLEREVCVWRPPRGLRLLEEFEFEALQAKN